MTIRHETLHVSLPSLTPKQRLTGVVVVSSLFFIAEIAVGFSTRSLALVADAFHYLSDLVGFIVALTAIQISETKKSPKDFSFGWQRAQLLGAFFNGVFLAALGLSIFLQAVERFVSVQKVENPKLVLIIGCIGLALNLISVGFLHDHGHGHAGGGEGTHAYLPPVVPGRATGVEATRLSFNAASANLHATHRHETNEPSRTSARNLGIIGVLLHVIGDAMNNVGVIASALAIWFGKTQGRFYADPAVSMGISFMILGTSLPLIKNAGRILLQTGPDGVDMAEVKDDIQGLPGVSSVHELHIWRLNEQKTIATAHVVTDDETLASFIECAKQIGECLHAYGVTSYTLQPEPKAASRQNIAAEAGGTGSDSGSERINEERGSVRMAELRQREPFCQLKCEAGTCRELQCCDD